MYPGHNLAVVRAEPYMYHYDRPRTNRSSQAPQSTQKPTNNEPRNPSARIPQSTQSGQSGGVLRETWYLDKPVPRANTWQPPHSRFQPYALDAKADHGRPPRNHKAERPRARLVGLLCAVSVMHRGIFVPKAPSRVILTNHIRYLCVNGIVVNLFKHATGMRKREIASGLTEVRFCFARARRPQ